MLSDRLTSPSRKYHMVDGPIDEYVHIRRFATQSAARCILAFGQAGWDE